MNQMSPPEPDFLADVLAYVEAHRDEPMVLAELAAIAGFSPYHFSRLFTARFGESVMDYVRTVRLEKAAARLVGDSPPSLIDLAFDCGFESQEAFTRAFRRAYGVPPGQYKRESPRRLLVTETLMPSKAKANVDKLPDLVKRPAFTVAGPSALFNAENKSGIPALWPRLIRALPLAGQADARTYGVCKMIDKTEGCLKYIAGVEVKGDTPLPDGFERIDIASHTYAVFRLTLDGSALHPQMQTAMPVIWGELLPKSGLKTVPSPDFELYPADFEPMRKGTYVDMYIAVDA
ncbi:MAG: AraC family transcriptional regulator [Alphaproteobacteria bacterium]|nr:AraC family transcriptional regulator [Alphaproteobacteria bacterium]MBL6939970.1 AraC family transcriptional regulator [Alphaproteobacteria bacterium]MBL7098174.1 AraC family transcriptional regulator [Alphaproteobacteria bacterium]